MMDHADVLLIVEALNGIKIIGLCIAVLIGVFLGLALVWWRRP